MGRTFTCACCRRIQPANFRCKDQKYCGRATCQRERKRRWQAGKMDADADYREDQREAYKSWRERNPDYWRQRRAIPKEIQKPSVPEKKMSATRQRKMDALSQNLYQNSGEYLLVPTGIKMDALRVKIIPIAPG
jgi:hypothetical protein